MDPIHAQHPPARADRSCCAGQLRLGAVTAEALADVQGSSVASARARLVAAERAGLL